MKFSFKENSIIATIIIIASFFSCTKYEKGPKISFRNKENLLFHGEWSLINIHKNGNYYYNTYTMQQGSDTLSIAGAYFPTGKLSTIAGNGRVANIFITSELNKKTNELKMTPIKYMVKNTQENTTLFQTNTIPNEIELLLPEGTSVYKILRLTKEELILRSVNMSNTYELHFLIHRFNE